MKGFEKPRPLGGELYLGSVTGPQVTGVYSVSGSVVTFQPNVPLPQDTLIHIQIETDEVRDLAGNGFLGVRSKSFQTIATVGLNEAVIQRYVEHQERVDKGQIQLEFEF